MIYNIENLKNSVMKIVHQLFVLCGGKFYLDYILLSNPTSKNPLINLLYGKWGQKKHKYNFKYKERLEDSFWFGIVHLGGLIVFTPTLLSVPTSLFWMNITLQILGNLFPFLVQVYIGIRCYRIIKIRKLNNLQSV